MLATHSLQTHQRVIAQSLPPASLWRKAVSAEAGDARLLDSTVGSPTAQNLIRLPAHYILGPGLSDEARALWQALYHALHGFQRSHAQRFQWQLLELLHAEGRP